MEKFEDYTNTWISIRIRICLKSWIQIHMDGWMDLEPQKMNEGPKL
jgi:hypothetical protein